MTATKPRSRLATTARFAVPALVALVAGVALGLLLRPEPTETAAPGQDTIQIVRGPFTIGGDFDLVGRAKQRVQLSDFHDKAVLLFFGYTHCPDICPGALADMRLVKQGLESDAERFQGLFISVDPARDKPDHLHEYVTHFDPGFIGLTGSKEEIDTVTRRYGVAYEIGPPLEGGGYTVGHSGFTFLVAPDGELAALFPYGTPWETMLDEVRRIL